MKTVLMILALMCLLVAGCQEGIKPVAWVLSDSDAGSANAQTTIRAGIEFNKGTTEAGLTSNYIRDSTQNIGIYVTQFVLNDPNGLPLLKRVYVGGQATLDLDQDGGMYGPLAGTVEKIGGIDWVIEPRYVRYNLEMQEIMGKEGEFLIFAGPRIGF